MHLWKDNTCNSWINKDYYAILDQYLAARANIKNTGVDSVAA